MWFPSDFELTVIRIKRDPPVASENLESGEFWINRYSDYPYSDKAGPTCSKWKSGIRWISN